MRLAKVVGTVNSTPAETALVLVQPLDELLAPAGDAQPVINMAGAKAGDLVLIEEDGAATPTSDQKYPSIVAIAQSAVVMAREEIAEIRSGRML